jgi:hypothetical protein
VSLTFSKLWNVFIRSDRFRARQVKINARNRRTFDELYFPADNPDFQKQKFRIIVFIVYSTKSLSIPLDRARRVVLKQVSGWIVYLLLFEDSCKNHRYLGFIFSPERKTRSLSKMLHEPKHVLYQLIIFTSLAMNSMWLNLLTFFITQNAFIKILRPINYLYHSIDLVLTTFILKIKAEKY